MKTDKMLATLWKPHFYWKFKTPLNYTLGSVHRLFSTHSTKNKDSHEVATRDSMWSDPEQQSCDHLEGGNSLASNQQLHPEGGDGKVFNQVNIQMLYEDMHRQLFGATAERPCVGEEVMSSIVSHLQEHGLWGKPTSELPPVPLKLPPLHGDLDSHFRHIAGEVSRPYRDQAERLAELSLPPPPTEWAAVPGWTRYCHNTGTRSRVSFPSCPGLIFDVEVLVTEGQFPTMATAASPNAWYSWCSPRIFTDDRHCGKVQLSDLIPMETSEHAQTPPANRWMNRLIIGHNVSFDRSFIREQYYVDGPLTRFLDTMSLHIAVCGLTSTQRILYQAFRKGESGFSRKEIRDKFRPGTFQSFQWLEESSMNNLHDVHQLYCPHLPPLHKATRDVFVNGTMEDVRNQIQALLTYCAGDVQGTHAVFREIWPQFKQRLPHPVTFSGMLEMGTAYLPVRSSWQRYVAAAETVYEEHQMKLRDTLMGLAESALDLWEGDRYLDDLWLWDLDWSPRRVRVGEDKSQRGGKEEESGTKKKKPKKWITETYPVWYSDLIPRPAEKAQGLPEGPSKISTLRRCTPKLLKLTWRGFPLHYERQHGWGYLKPEEGAVVHCGADDVVDELIQQEEEMEADDGNKGNFPLNRFLSYCAGLPEYESERRSVQEAREQEEEVMRVEEELEASETEEERIALYRRLQEMKRLAGRGKLLKKPASESEAEDGSHDIGIPGVVFFRLPHKNGPKHRVGNPLSKDFLSQIESGVLGSALTDLLTTVHSLSKRSSYWKNNRKRVKEQMDVQINSTPGMCDTSSDVADTEDPYVGAILPRLVTAGTVTRRAVENTWLTASNAYADSIGSEMKAMVQSPPGHCFVGADVDSQELWIAAVLGDSYFGGIHGCTALGWMTLQGNKADGTDLHSKVAALVAISRDQAKVFNYGRIYGAGQSFAKQLLMQFNHSLTENQAEKKARTLYHSTKGKKKKSFDVSGDRWEGGSESAMFNKLEKVIVEGEPRTPVLGCQISKALEPDRVSGNFLTSRVNWVVQSSAVDYLHLMLVCMAWLCDKYQIQARFCISIHDEVRYLVRHEDRHRAALALQITNLLTRAMFAHKLGINDLPQSVGFFSTVDLDTCLRKESDLDCVTPSNPHGLRDGYGIQPGESLSVYDILELTGGALHKHDHQPTDGDDQPLDFIDFG